MLPWSNASFPSPKTPSPKTPFPKTPVSQDQPCLDSTRVTAENTGTSRAERPGKTAELAGASERICVYLAVENRLLREALTRTLSKRGGMEVEGAESSAPFHSGTLLGGQVDVLLLVSRGNLERIWLPSTKCVRKRRW
jgi:hypothetical protein